MVTIHTAEVAGRVPESTAVSRCAVFRHRAVVVSVECAEHSAVVVVEGVELGVTRVPRHCQPVVGRLQPDYERTILGVVPVSGVVT